MVRHQLFNLKIDLNIHTYIYIYVCVLIFFISLFFLEPKTFTPTDVSPTSICSICIFSVVFPLFSHISLLLTNTYIKHIVNKYLRRKFRNENQKSILIICATLNHMKIRMQVTSASKCELQLQVKINNYSV